MLFLPGKFSAEGAKFKLKFNKHSLTVCNAVGTDGFVHTFHGVGKD